MMHHNDFDALLPPLPDDDAWVWPMTGADLEQYLATCEPAELRTLARELTYDLAAALARYVPAEKVTEPTYDTLFVELGASGHTTKGDDS